MALTQVDPGLLGQYAQYTGFKNRVINGAMMIDQRNVGAAVTYGSTTVAGNYYGYNVDRWWAQSYSTTANNGAAFTIQQSSAAPTGFNTSIAATVTSAQSTLQNDSLYRIQQIIEGYNVSDLGWGTSSASTVTLSFWVRSSLTGTFTGVVTNDVDYSYSFTYTIAASNVWQYVSIMVPGATAGTWPKTTGKGMLLAWCLGAHSSRLSTAGTWTASANYQGAVGQTNFMATAGATFNITGVQLEKGSTATSFDYRPYGVELQLCQRYYCHSDASNAAPNVNAALYNSAGIAIDFEDAAVTSVTFPVMMRTTPTMTVGRAYSYNGTLYKTINSITATSQGISYFNHDAGNSAGTYVLGRAYKFPWIASAEF